MQTDMRAVTVWQPWARLIAIGAKPYEFRGRPAPKSLIDRRIAIHAGARPVRKDEVRDLLLRFMKDGAFGTALIPELAVPLLERLLINPTILPLSSILCTAVLGASLRPSHLFRGPTFDSTRINHSVWAWPLSDMQVLEPFVPAIGAQGFWAWRNAGAAAHVAVGAQCSADLLEVS